MTQERIGFIGLGDIGKPMAMRILQAGHPLRVYNRTAAKTDEFVALGTQRAGSARELAQQCDIVFTCVSDTAAVEQVVFGPEGIAAGGRAGLLLVDLSTIHPQRTREMARRLHDSCGAAWVDSPVSGGAVGARAGTLAAMVGGAPADVERVRPVLMAFSGRVTHMGGVGCGMAMKACNQMINYGSGTLIAETLNLAARFGIDPALVPQAVAGGFADSRIMQHHAPAMVDGSYKGNGRTAMKDIDIILSIAEELKAPIPITALTASLFHQVIVEQGFVAGGLCSVMHMYAQGPLKATPPADDPA